MNLSADRVLFTGAALAAVAAIVLNVVGPSEYAILGWVAAALFGVAGAVAQSARWGTLAGAVLALLASLYLYWLKVSAADGPALCSVSTTIDCVSINQSPYSVIFGGTAIETPITLLGTAYFAGLMVASLAALAKAPKLFQVSALFGLANVLVTLYLASVLLVEQKLCVFCVAIYGSNALVLWAAFKGMRASNIALLDNLPDILKARSFMVIATCFVAIVAAGSLLYPQGPDLDTVIDRSSPEAAQRTLSQVDIDRYIGKRNINLELHGAEPSKGSNEPTYRVVEFADYACPHCKDASLELLRGLDKHPDLQVMFKAYPLDPSCNPAIPDDVPSTFPQRCIPALYAECARQQGKFWDVNRDIFQNQDVLTRSQFNLDDMNLLVRNRGVDLGVLATCLEDPESQRMVMLDGLAGANAGVDATPTFFVQGLTDDGSWVRLNLRKGVSDLFLVLDAHRSR